MNLSGVRRKIRQLWEAVKLATSSAPVKTSVLVEDSEPLSRYLLSSGWLDKTDPKKPRIKPVAFIPHPYQDTSVFRVGGWDKSKLRAVGVSLADEREAKHKERHLAQGKPYPDGKRSINLHGTALIMCRHVRAIDLRVDPEEPPKWHAIIVGWPPSVNDRKKDEAAQLAIALKLVAKAEFDPLNV